MIREKNMAEPKIVIEGTELTEAQAMTVRVALDDFRERHQTGALGADQHGRTMSSAYAKRSDEVLTLIHQKVPDSFVSRHRARDDITPMDQAICALRVAPGETVGMSVSIVIALTLFGRDSQWWGTALVIAMIFGALLYRATPAIIEATKERVKVRNRYPY